MKTFVTFMIGFYCGGAVLCGAIAAIIEPTLITIIMAGLLWPYHIASIFLGAG